ncbi:unnamed protein product [Enterobius vermicularis]|uniref:Uncharacterized protein n=1 Tax=Enterobius vermicularis TaxID=51028 RepID=A0A0N4VJU2_ENTVE|nr:unnamed protein product [Enterobius vermicularis]
MDNPSRLHLCCCPVLPFCRLFSSQKTNGVPLFFFPPFKVINTQKELFR